MKKLITALALLGAMASGSYAAPNTADVAAKDTGALSSAYDPSADVTTMTSREVKITVGNRSVTAQASFTYPGKAPVRPKEITFRLSSGHTGGSTYWETLESFIYFKVGDQVIQLPLQNMGGGGFGGYAFEDLEAQIPVDTFTKIFSAKALTLRLQHHEDPPFVPAYQENYPFDEASLAPFKELLKSLPAAR